MNRSRPRTVLVLLGLFLAAFTVSAAPGGRPRFGELVIEDDDAAVWMTINNTFMKKTGQTWDPAKEEWDGVLIQLGEYESMGLIFKGITFERQNRIVHELPSLADFRWINIVAEDPLPGRKQPMDPPLVDLLLPSTNNPLPTACDEVNASANMNRLCLKQSCAAGELKVIPKACLRIRSLHGYFTPKAIITYWQGPYGFEVAVGSHRGGEHVRHTFTFNDEVKIYIDGIPLAARKGRIDTIRIKAEVGTHITSPHGGGDSPPWSE